MSAVLRDPLSSPPPRIVGISGSLRDTSFTRRAVELALVAARAAGAEARLLDLHEFHLPWCDGTAATRAGIPDVERLRREVQNADGFLLGTPEYHGSFSGVLKNALDLTELDDWRGKVIALVGVSGGSAGPGSALVGLRTVGRGLAAWVLPRQVSIASAHRVFEDPTGTAAAEATKQLAELAGELVRFARLHSIDRTAQ